MYPRTSATALACEGLQYSTRVAPGGVAERGASPGCPGATKPTDQKQTDRGRSPNGHDGLLGCAMLYTAPRRSDKRRRGLLVRGKLTGGQEGSIWSLTSFALPARSYTPTPHSPSSRTARSSRRCRGGRICRTGRLDLENRRPALLHVAVLGYARSTAATRTRAMISPSNGASGSGSDWQHARR